MGITDEKLLFCHGISEGRVEKIFLTREYNNRKVHDCLNKKFTADCGIPYLNLSPITIDDIPCPHKRPLYTPYLLPDAIYVASENSVSTLTTPSNFTKLLVPTSDDTNPHHEMKKDVNYCGRVKI